MYDHGSLVIIYIPALTIGYDEDYDLSLFVGYCMYRLKNIIHSQVRTFESGYCLLDYWGHSALDSGAVLSSPDQLVSNKVKNI